MPWRWRLERAKEAFWMKLAWLLPKTLVKWAAVRLGAHATTGKYGNQIVPELGFMDALKRWDEVEALG